MGAIQLLPETVQNKIAAGEVIERPASVVKELVENALDAGAGLVAVELEDGGHRLIRVSDDGLGMDEDDLVLSVQRHATSKIETVEDIFRIATFGFRGEALPSIGSVSRLAVVTCRRGADSGHELLVEAGKTLRLSPAAPRKGTRVEVRDIFFNTPARRKFLSQPASENTRAAEIMTRLALGNPEVGFRLQTNDRLVLSVRPAASQLERIGDLFGHEVRNRLVPFANDITDGLSVSGFFARPPHSRRNSKDIYILVNRRWIRYYGLARAIADAFQGVLPPREYPFGVVNIQVDPARVDVNAHPAKEEVRFEQAAILIAGVKRAVREALLQVAQVPTAHVVRPEPAPEAGPEPRRSEAFFSRPPPRSSGGETPETDWAAVRERLRGADAPPPPPAAVNGSPEPEAKEPGVFDAESAFAPTLLGQADGKYIVFQDARGLILVDPHALHERWNFDRLLARREKGGDSVRLLIPQELRLSPAEAAAAVEAVPALAEYGFDFRLPEANRLVVAAAPSFVPPDKLELLVRQVLGDVGDAAGAVAKLRENLLASLACRMSVLLGRTLPEEEMRVLADRFLGTGQMPTCPHGRPTAIRIGWEEVARRFKR